MQLTSCQNGRIKSDNQAVLKRLQSPSKCQGGNVQEWLGRRGHNALAGAAECCVREEWVSLTCMLGPRRPLCWWCCRWANALQGLCTPAILAWCLRSWMRSRVNSSGCSQARVRGGPQQVTVQRDERKYLITIWALYPLYCSGFQSQVTPRAVQPCL